VVVKKGPGDRPVDTLRRLPADPLARMESVLVLACFAQRWRFRLDRRARGEPRALITLRPRCGLPMRAGRRG